MKISRVLVPLDGRPASEAALPAAIELARQSGGSLYLLRVLGPPEPTPGPLLQHEAAAQKAEGYLAAMRQRLAAQGIRDIHTAVWSGTPAAAIVKAADLTEADMIVMATSGQSGPPRALVGSVVDRVLRGTKRPVLVIRPADAVVDASLGDAVPLPDHSVVASPGSLRPAPGDRYLDAWRDLQQHEREVLRIVTTIQEAARNLERWQAVHVAHAGAGFPTEVTMTGRVVDASTWPTAQQLADALAAWHSAAEAAREAWHRDVPPEQRASLPPPA